MVKNLPAKQEMPVQPLGWEDPLEKEMATYSSICLGNPMDRGAWWVIVRGVAKESDTTEQLNNINRVGQVRTS